MAAERRPDAAPERDGGQSVAGGRWCVMLETYRQRWGGDLRRAQLFRGLATRTGATILDGWGRRPLRDEFGLLRILPTPLGFLPRPPRPRLASSEMIRPDVLRMAQRVLDPVAVAVYDDPVAQAHDLGIVMPAARQAYFNARKRANLRAFRWHVVPTASFAEHIGLDMSRLIVAGNGTDTGHVLPGEWPEDPAIGMISGAAPGRGIETLITAARELRNEIPELRLLLWLAATGDDSEAYLRALERSTATERWIEIATADYDDLSDALRQATVLTIPHPPGEYYDVALPVKLLDSMAAGRPLVVTPRHETKAIVEQYGVGIVTSGDAAEDIADGLRQLIVDPARAREIGRRARDVAVEVYDWQVVGDRLASAVLEREAAPERAAAR
jgi:glycosyltransferase involved in cell wall biosynthesis